MTIFPEQPDIRPIDKRTYRLIEDFSYDYEPGVRLLIPAGFESDGASVPRWAWSASGITPDGLLRAAALVHDWLYRHDGRLYERRFTRKEADALFKRIMRESGVGKRKSWIAWMAVRIGARKW